MTRATRILALLAALPSAAQVFGTATTYGAGELPVALQVADFDGKLGPDIAVCNRTDGTISIFLARGDGTYAAAIVGVTVTAPEALVALDVERDGDVDLVATTMGGGTGTPQLLTLKNDGTASFKSTALNTGSFVRALAAADIDRNGTIDLAGAAETADKAAIFFCSSLGAFTVGPTYTVGDNPTAIAASDLDGANGPDLAVVHSGGTDGVTVLLNSGTGTFGTGVEYATATNGTPLFVGRLLDLDGALGPDLVVADSLTADVAVLLATGAGAFGTATTYPVPGGGAPSRLAVADVDGDTLRDVVVGQGTGRGISVLLGTGGTLVADPSSPYAVALDVQDLQLSDVDFDNAPDAVLATAETGSPTLPGTAVVLRNLLGPIGPIVTTTSLPDGAVGVAYAATLQASGGTPPYNWSKAGSLPAGLALDAASGVISGTPTSAAAGTGYFTVRATDSAGMTGQRPLALTVLSASDVITAKGPGSGAAYDQITKGLQPDGTAIAALSIPAFTLAGYGARVGGGDIDGGGIDEILATPGPGATHPPAVRGFKATGAAIGKVDFFAYGATGYGAGATAADIDALLHAEILTGPGPGAVYAPQVRAWSYDGTSYPQALTKVNYYAYGTLKYGCNVAGGEMDGDGIDEVLTGAGPGAVFGPHVRGWNYDGAAITKLPGLSYFAYGTLRFGVNVDGAELDGDPGEEILTGAGPGYVFGAHLRGFQYTGTAVAAMPNLSAVVFTTRYGVNVGRGDVDSDGFDEILGGQGPDPAAASRLAAFNYDGASLSAIAPLTKDIFGVAYGLRAEGLVLGY